MRLLQEKKYLPDKVQGVGDFFHIDLAMFRDK
jgi:hypothetical protein